MRQIFPVLLMVILTAAACGKKEEKAKPVAESRGGLDTDYAGKIAVLLASDSLNAQENVKLAQYAYQMTCPGRRAFSTPKRPDQIILRSLRPKMR